jgi:hypothetical protein
LTFRISITCNATLVSVRTSLRCAECGRTADETADGWKAYLAVTEEDDNDLEVDVFSPECAAREFGEGEAS